MTDSTAKGIQDAVSSYALGLEKMQGYAPQLAYILARGYKTQLGGINNCFEYLAPVETASFVSDAISAADWIREMRSNGFSGLGSGPIHPLECKFYIPSHSNLRIDYSKEHGQWQSAAKYLATAQNELTMIPGIRIANRNALLTGTPSRQWLARFKLLHVGDRSCKAEWCMMPID